MARLQDAAMQEAGGGGAPVTPGLAQAAAQAGAPPVGAEAGAGAPPPAPAPGAQAAAAAPSPEPAAPPPGAGAPPPGAEPRPQQGARAAPPGSPQGALQPYMQNADEREQQEYGRAMRAVAKILYVNDQTSNAIVDQIRPDNLVSDTSKVSMVFIKELDRNINMDEAVVASVTQEAVTRIAELAEARHSVEYSAADMEQIVGATWEGVQSMFGNTDVQGYTQTVQGIAPQDMDALKKHQDQLLGNTSGA